MNLKELLERDEQSLHIRCIVPPGWQQNREGRMDIGTFREKRRKLEGALQLAISNLVADFERDTGVNVHRISVDMLDVTTTGEPPKYIVGKVDVDAPV